jgi:hypothetical protein
VNPHAEGGGELAEGMGNYAVAEEALEVRIPWYRHRLALTGFPCHTTVRSDHEYGGSADAVRVMCTPQPECHLPVRQPRVHPRCRTQAQHLAGCRLTAPPQATTPLYRSGLQQKTLRLGLSVSPPFGSGVPH